ncbi:MAG: hypothetical protein OHK0013_49100 [Sandaracinaceae bacterium]
MTCGRAALTCTLVLGGAACDPARFVPLDAGPPPGARVPQPPPAERDGPSGPERVFVLRDVVLEQGMGTWRTLGWDLDERCSYAPGSVDAGGPTEDAGMLDAGAFGAWDIECAPAGSAELPSEDGDACRDNNYGQFLSLALAPLGIDVEDGARARMLRGEFAFLVRVRDYDGDGDDPQVTADVVGTAYGVRAGGTRGDPLRWDGTDTFFPAEGSFRPSGEPVILDPAAFVADGLLVVHIPPRADFRFAGADRSFVVQLTDATLTGTIAGERLEGAVIAGRWGIADFFAQLPEIGLCDTSPFRGVVENGVRSAADVLANPDSRPGTLVPCDAVSFAVGFTGYPGRVGAMAQPLEGVPDPCP